MKKSLLLVLSLALISPLVAADPAQPAPSQPSPVEPDPAQLTLAHQVIKATQFDRMFDQLAPQMQQMAAQAMNLSTMPVAPAEKEAATKVLGQIAALAAETSKKVLQNVDAIYADVYSTAELKAILAFFDSPEGQAMIQKQPQVQQRMRTLVQGMQQELMPKIQQIVEKAKTEAAAAAPATPEPAPAPAK